MTDEMTSRIPLRLLFYPIWFTTKLNKLPTQRNNHLSNKQIFQNKHGKQNFSNNSRNMLDYQNALTDGFAAAGLPSITYQTLKTTFSRLKRFYDCVGDYPNELFQTKHSKLGFVISSTIHTKPIPTLYPGCKFYKLMDEHMTRETSEERVEIVMTKILDGELIRSSDQLILDKFEHYVFDSTNIKSSEAFLRNMTFADFSFLSYEFINDLTATELSHMPEWTTALISKMNVLNLSSVVALNVNSIDHSQQFGVIKLLISGINTEVGSFWTIIDGNHTIEDIIRKTTNIRLVNSSECTSGNLNHLLFNCLNLEEPLRFNPNLYSFKLLFHGTGLNPSDDHALIRMKDLIDCFNRGEDVQVIGNKCTGKSTLVKELSVRYNKVLVVDSDDFGRFLTLLVNALPVLFLDYQFLVNNEVFDETIYTHTLLSYVTAKAEGTDGTIDIFFEHLMEQLISICTDVNGQIDVERVLDRFNTSFHSIINSTSIGYRVFITKLRYFMFENYQYEQMLHFVHTYSELSVVPHNLAYLTLVPSYDPSCFLHLDRKNHISRYNGGIEVETLLQTFYGRYTTEVNPTSVFLFRYFFGLTKGLSLEALSSVDLN
jgi:hypothetical protein